ncbi:MAG: D-aminoacyl-tRNA deacylase [archaeon]
MYKKYLIIASKKDLAGANITTNLSQFRQNPLFSSLGDKPNFDFYLIEDETIYTKNLDLNKINHYDFIIFASKHKSEKNEKTLSIHAPGNFRTSDYGGEKEKLCPTSALFQKQIFEKLNANAKEHNLKDYKITLECTHHGPLINKPCIFIEIGSTENEWKDRRAGFVLAKTIRDMIEGFEENPYNEIAIGLGGPHYCPNFNKIQLNSNVALSHIIPQYAMPITEEMIKEAIAKTQEEVDFAVLDWKGLGISEQRQQVIDILEKNYIAWKRTSEIGK